MHYLELSKNKKEEGKEEEGEERQAHVSRVHEDGIFFGHLHGPSLADISKRVHPACPPTPHRQYSLGFAIVILLDVARDHENILIFEYFPSGIHLPSHVLSILFSTFINHQSLLPCLHYFIY